MMNPEDDFRYLPPPRDFDRNALVKDDIVKDLAEQGLLLGTFSTLGWRVITETLESARENTMHALTALTGATKMEDILGLRQRLQLIDELLGWPANAEAARARDVAALNKIDREEQQ